MLMRLHVFRHFGLTRAYVMDKGNLKWYSYWWCCSVKVIVNTWKDKSIGLQWQEQNSLYKFFRIKTMMGGRALTESLYQLSFSTWDDYCLANYNCTDSVSHLGFNTHMDFDKSKIICWRGESGLWEYVLMLQFIFMDFSNLFLCFKTTERFGR